ncbi:MAG: SGNH/GDSL hydrolase family protein [Verrucomicrobia bacterium]|nr:SGNH/GDSL hydrolase family protein [Verrucomicrobiota bacterium]
MNLTMMFRILMVALFAASGGLRMCAESAVYPPTRFPDALGWGKNIQRTMRLLATSTAEKRNTVRILFYGQSITEQKWAKLVEEDLRRRFPHANLVVENRALGGFSSQILVKTAETDLYSFQPDLLIFHVYGSHDKYEDIIRRMRERTTAEILMQNDHLTKPADFTEETDADKLPPAGKHWDAFMNHNWLPSLAKKYGAELCDQRALWKAYLRENNLEPKTLLKDSVHLNAHEEWFMAECVKAYLRYDPKLGPSPAEGWVKTYEVGKDLRWMNGKLRLEFQGNCVEVVCKPGTAGPAAVRIDGRKPSEFPELYGFTRAVTQPSGKWLVKWPVIAPIGAEKPLLIEDWTLAARRVDAANEKLFSFALTGSKTGSDGEGRSDGRFVSKSGRVVIETNDWNVTYALNLGGIKPVPDTFEVKWKVEARFVDEFVSPGVTDAAVETRLTLASGLSNGKHTLEIAGSEGTPIAVIRVYRPGLAPARR